MPVSG